MNFSTLVSKLDEYLSRDVLFMKTSDANSVSFKAPSDSELTATVDGTDYTNLIKVCLVKGESDVNVYINYESILKYEKLGLGNISSFSIS